ncbi:hypothetical protein PC128_g24143 [Phytophthora cactorum]|nr:hypothetical protein PC128_g24143 [Phytophthora cactorum]
MKTEAPCKLASSYYERRMIENEWSQNKYLRRTRIVASSCGGFGSVREIAFITGNASIHHREIVTEYLQDFGLIKSRLWWKRSGAVVTGESKALLKKNMSG